MDGFEMLSLALGAILADNFIFSQFLDVNPFLAGSRRPGAALRMGLAVTFVMGLASAVCWPVNQFLLNPNGLEFLRPTAFILVIATLVQVVELCLKGFLPALYAALGVFLPRVATNCAVLGAVLLSSQKNLGFLPSVLYGVAGGLGFLLAICLFANVRERQSFCACPKAFEGAPIALVTAGLLALCFMGFSGLDITR